jgi:hypothetical protein
MGGLPDDAKKTATEYADWVQAHRNLIPNWFPVDHAKDAFAATYPFHPSLLSVFRCCQYSSGSGRLCLDFSRPAAYSAYSPCGWPMPIRQDSRALTRIRSLVWERHRSMIPCSDHNEGTWGVGAHLQERAHLGRSRRSGFFT